MSVTHFKKVFPNGLRLITVPIKNNQTATVMVLVEAGSNYESKEENGISHFLEHVCFKGSEKRTLHDITYDLDSIGALSNAFTGNEYTGYYAKANSKHLETILDVVSDLYLNPIFPEDEIKKEKGVIIEEINMYEDQPQKNVWNTLEALMYGDQPAGRTILGTKQNIKKVKRSDFVAYHSKHYVASATTVVVAGDVKVETVENLVAGAFRNISTKKPRQKKKVVEQQSKVQFKVKAKKTDQAHIAFGFRSFPLGDERNWATSVLSTILGRGMSSRLFKKMRDELGICYYVGAGDHPSTDHGVFTVYAGVGKKRIEEAVFYIVEELRRLKTEQVADRELRKAKDYSSGQRALHLEASDQWAEWYGFQEIHRENILTPQEVDERIEAVTAEDIQAVAQTLFNESNLNVAIVGEVSKSTEIKKLLTL